MSLNLTLINVTYLISVIVGLIVGLVTLTYGVKKGKPNALLGASFIFLSLAIFIVFLIDSKLMPYFPNWYRTGNLFGLIYAPLPYLYFRHTLFPGKFKAWQLLHFLAAFLFFIDYLPIFVLSAAGKIDLINAEIMDPTIFVEFSQSRVFPASFYTPFRTILLNIYWVFSALTFRKFLKISEFKPNQKPLRTWIQGYLALLTLLFVPFYFTFLVSDSTTIFRLIHFSAAILLLVSAVYLLFFPSILYGISDQMDNSLIVQKKDASPKDLLDREKVQEIEKALMRKIDLDQVHLIQGYTAQDLAKDTGFPYYVLTSYLNQNLEMKFTDFINKKRIEYALDLLNSKESSSYTLEAIGNRSGFKNRNSFSSAFKKVTGKTPSSYLRSKSTTA
ncbi:helix-turn-helix domain-containing protein [Algoriphagus sediminis]|uniref:Helix-turn-helix domain-containing protein n=1 Tax=Algoriphagus sediminis TaxID=3057113 RepID=A0ABT7Y9J7_9BACT|nr:helix-turn-helix domain-containing protein [Algoriphagus sediminis]MDN3203187.1 helix-turn-helix domain-containing protein [Algoriphagus sediminis]